MNDMVAITPAPVASAPTVAPAKSGLRNRRRSSIGARRRNSTTTKATASTAPPASRPITAGWVQPDRPSTRPARTPASAEPSNPMPARSTASRRSDLDSVSSLHESTASTAASTAVAPYALRQPSAASSPAASSGPSAIPPPTHAPHTPVAWTRPRPGGNACPMRPRLQARIAAPPRPCPMRATTRTAVPGASAASTEVRASRTAPAANMRRRPWSSPMAPAGSNPTARPQLIELRIHA
jgi:hypothetical protein